MVVGLYVLAGQLGELSWLGPPPPPLTQKLLGWAQVPPGYNFSVLFILFFFFFVL